MKFHYFVVRLVIFASISAFFKRRFRSNHWLWKFFKRQETKLRKRPEMTRYAAVCLARTMKLDDLKKVIHFLSMIDTYGRCSMRRRIESEWDNWGRMIYMVKDNREIFHFEILRPPKKSDWRPLIPMSDVFDNG